MISVDPNQWTPGTSTIRRRTPEQGTLIGLRYATWRVIEVRPVEDCDLSEEDAEAMRQWAARYEEPHRAARADQVRPTVLVLRHERGPLLFEAVQVLDDGSRTVHLRTTAGHPPSIHVVREPYTLCSCHEQPWPCQDWVQAQLAAVEAAKMERELAGAAPGVCAACRETVSRRQKTVRFPEPSLIVPGAAGPTFHASRSTCWMRANEYEVERRLAAYPDAARIASCPGRLFVHMIGLLRDCSAGADCTGHHGPGRPRSGTCATQVYVVGSGGPVAETERPTTDCGYRHENLPDFRCLGSAGPRRDLPSAIVNLFGR